MFLFIIIEFFLILHYLFVVIFSPVSLVDKLLIIGNKINMLMIFYALFSPKIFTLFYQHLLNLISHTSVYSVFKTC